MNVFVFLFALILFPEKKLLMSPFEAPRFGSDLILKCVKGGSPGCPHNFILRDPINPFPSWKLKTISNQIFFKENLKVHSSKLSDCIKHFSLTNNVSLILMIHAVGKILKFDFLLQCCTGTTRKVLKLLTLLAKVILG